MSTFTALNGGSPKTSEPPGKAADSAAVDEQRPVPVDGQSSRKASFDRPRPQVTTFTETSDPSLKRKRSSSAELRRESATQERTPDTATVPSHGEHRDVFGTPQREQIQGSPDTREKDAWYSNRSRERSPYDSQHNGGSSPRGHDDDIRNTSQGGPGDYPNSSPEAEEKSGSLYGSQYASEGRQNSILQHDPKKRKRNFSNRTKTGCMTCRKRKKKCDEQKPECANCIRGGFECAGYPPQRGPGWQKPENKLPTVPLESKDPSYVPPGAYGMPQQQQGPYGNQPVKREPLPHYRGQALRIDPPQGRPLVSDDDRPTASTIPSASVASPDNKLSAIPYTPANPFPTPISANPQPPPFPDRMAKDYPRVPLHDLTRGEPETPHPGNHLPQINILHPTRTSSPAPPGQAPPSNAQVAAQLALSHSHSQYPHRRTQKEEMLSGRQFYPFDKELCLERERCATACWRFNNLTAPPSNGVSPDERSRLFNEILRPRDSVRLSLAEATPITNVGRVGRNVTVETPFTCDYGYNIIIGNHVSIGRNCTINDVCEVKIGDNCVIGPNVSIFTATLPIDPKRRQGGQGPQSGKSVVIEQDCWIAGGAMILAGKTIGKGSTVGAGSVVTKDVPPFTVVAGNPARVLRGIAS